MRSTSPKCCAIGTSPVRQTLASWACLSAFCARADESELQHRTSLDAQNSSASSQATTDSIASVTTTPAVVDVTSPSRMRTVAESFLSDQSNDSSDEDEFETVASPPSAYRIAAARSPAPSVLTNEPPSTTATTETAQACSDPPSAASLGNITSPSLTSQINPFKQLVLKDKHSSTEGTASPDIVVHESSPLIGGSSLISSPVDLHSLLAHESHRLETFRRQHRSTFARIDVAHLAYVGFFLHVGGDHVECPWCEVELTEERMMHIMDTQPSVARSTLSDEPWTPMRVHRHANGLRMGQAHSWCTWVRREAGGLYPNIAMVSNGQSRTNRAILSVRDLVGKSTALSRVSVVCDH